jgi:hypothetical protein
MKDAVRATIPLLDFFRHRKLPVFFTRIVYADDGSDCGVWCEKALRLRDLIERAPASGFMNGARDPACRRVRAALLSEGYRLPKAPRNISSVR